MNKQRILSFIQKYHLNGLIESVVWESNGILKTRFMSDDRNLIGSVEYNTIDTKDFESAKLGIYKTSSLVKLLNVPGGDELTAKINFSGDKPISVKLKDENDVEIEYALSDLVVIPSVPQLKYEPQEYDVKIKVNSDFSDRFIRASNSMPEVVNFSVASSSKKATIHFGQTDVNVNRAKFPAETEALADIEKQVYDVSLFKQILSVNKGIDSSLSVSKEGIAKIIFKTDDYVATYYLIAKK